MRSTRSARTVVIVAGTGVRDGAGRHVITPATLARVRCAERLAVRLRPVAVVFTGFSGWIDGPSEAEQMRRCWEGPDWVPIVLDEAARDTAENAICSVLLLKAIGDVERLVVVATWWDAVRTYLFFWYAIRRTAVRLRLRLTGGRGPYVRAGLSSLKGLTQMRPQWRTGVAFVTQGPRSPAATPQVEPLRAPQDL